MNDHATWSLNCGRWGGVHLRIHMFFLLFAAFTVFLSWETAGDNSGIASPETQIAVRSLAILLVSVLLRELGHAWAAVRLGGYVDQIVLGPLGGLDAPRGLYDPKAEMQTCLAGLLVNAGLCVICALLLSEQVFHLLHPLNPTDLTTGQVFIKLTFWINWVLLLLNLLPAFPFDGGRALRAAINWRWPEFSRRQAAMIVAALAKIVALVIFAVALTVEFDSRQWLISPRFAFVLLALFLFFSAKQEETYREMEEMSIDPFWGYDVAEGYPDFDPAMDELDMLELDAEEEEEAYFAQFYNDDAQSQESLQPMREADDERLLEERSLDEILAKVHAHGVESLSLDERALLNKISADYRDRLHRS